MAQKFANNATSRLASAITSSDTSCTLNSGDGSLFPSLSGSDYFLATLVSSTDREIVKVTAVATDTFTMTRAQEGTSAAAFASGDTIELRLTAAGCDNFMQLESGSLTSAQLATALTDETGTGVAVFGTAPTLSNPVVGTQTYGDNSTKAASTAFVQAAIATKVADGNSGTAQTIDWTTGNIHTSTLTGNCTYTFTAPSPALGVLILVVSQDGTGSRTVTWPGTVKWSGGTAPTLTTTASKTDIFTFYYDGTNYYGVTSGLNY